LSIYNDKGAYSLLHLNGTAPIQQNGYRPWMKTGITFTDNQDMSYFGLRQIGFTFMQAKEKRSGTSNRQDVVLNNSF
jgi:hypothetical protein